MHVKRIIVPTITLVIMASQLMGCAAASQSELLQMLEHGDQIEIEVAEPAFAEAEKGTESKIEWTELASLTTNDTLRTQWDDQLLITKIPDGKNGIFYVNESGEHENNNTLAVAIHNREFQKALENDDTRENLASSVSDQYADIEESTDRADITKAVYIGINGYFNLLPDNLTNYTNADSTLTRADFLAMVYRADTPVQELESDGLTNYVGQNDLNIYAQGVVKNSYLDIESKSLNNMTYNGSITRAEAIYTLVSRYFADELTTVDTKDAKFSDAKDGGDIASQQKFDTAKDYWKSYELTYALQNPDKGLPTNLYKALVVAQNKGLISSETRWDEAITKAEAVELLCDALMADDSIPTFSYDQGEITGNTVIDENTDFTNADISSEYDEEYPEGLYKEPTEETTDTNTNTTEHQFDLGTTEEQLENLKQSLKEGTLTKEEYDIMVKIVIAEGNGEDTTELNKQLDELILEEVRNEQSQQPSQPQQPTQQQQPQQSTGIEYELPSNPNAMDSDGSGAGVVVN